jgi:acetyl-CoA C-acetyltransferase
MSEAWIIDTCRTPRGIGKKGKGALADEHPQHLGAAVLKALQERVGFDTADVDDIIFGTSSQRGKQSGDLASVVRVSHRSTSRRLTLCRAWKIYVSVAVRR